MTTDNEIPETPVPSAGDKWKRRGRVYGLRITDEERARLELKEKQSRAQRLAERKGPGKRNKASLASYLVWAGLQWTPAQLELIPELPGPVRRRKARPAKKGKGTKSPQRGKVRPKPKKPKKKGGRRGGRTR